MKCGGIEEKGWANITSSTSHVSWDRSNTFKLCTPMVVELGFFHASFLPARGVYCTIHIGIPNHQVANQQHTLSFNMIYRFFTLL